MKRTILALILILPLLASAQSGFDAYEIEVDTFFDNTTQDPVAKGKICNTGASEISLYWRIEPVNVPFGWQSYFCDKNLCYGPSVIECPTDKPVVLSVGECGVMDLHLVPGASVEYGTYNVVVWEVGNPSNTLTMNYIFNSTTSTSDEVDLANLTVFPNPTVDYFQLSDQTGVSRIVVHDVIGKHVKDFNVVSRGIYDVSEVRNGLYVVNLLSDKNELLKSVRLTKK